MIRLLHHLELPKLRVRKRKARKSKKRLDDEEEEDIDNNDDDDDDDDGDDHNDGDANEVENESVDGDVDTRKGGLTRRPSKGTAGPCQYASFFAYRKRICSSCRYTYSVV